MVDLVVLAFIASAGVLGFLFGRGWETIGKRPASAPAPAIPENLSDGQLGAKVRSQLEKMLLQARVSGPGHEIEHAAVVTIESVKVCVRYTLDTDQLPKAKEVEARR